MKEKLKAATHLSIEKGVGRAALSAPFKFQQARRGEGTAPYLNASSLVKTDSQGEIKSRLNDGQQTLDRTHHGRLDG
jgi:hypothetical protein